MGQFRQGNRRWIAYVGVELAMAALYVQRRRDAWSLRTEYRDFAWEAARSGRSAEPRREGDFTYYETMSAWATSGAWDSDPERGGVQPERDPTSYNGSVWALARQIYSVDAATPVGSDAYGLALAYYRERGYGPAFLWEWRDGDPDRERFGSLIRRSDGRFGAARRIAWVLASNHLLSALDGFVTARLRSLPGRDGLEVGLAMELPWQ